MTLAIKTDVDLKNYSTMRLGGKASYLVEVTTRYDVPNAVDWAQSKSLPFVVIGHGSNTIWREEGFAGLVIVNNIKGFEHIDEDENNMYITLGAGEDWDETVKTSVELGFSDLAPLSLIPGTVGATPVQNVGAYGTEISQLLVSVEAYDTTTKQFVTIPSFECGFSYRSSRFKTTDKGKYIITGLSLHLTKRELEPPFYGDLQHYLTEHGIRKYTPEVVRQSVIAIRTLKLPDPKKKPNCGSFFDNPIIKREQFRDLHASQPDIRYWPTDEDDIKLSAAWLVEHAGFRGDSDEKTGMGTWPGQALVIVNNSAKSTTQLEEYVKKIVSAVKKKYGVTLEQEPQFIP